jgi:hypothetical protein
MSPQLRIAAVVTLPFAVAAFLPEKTSAQEIDFGKLDKFESFASGTLHVGAPPKTIVDDGERHLVTSRSGTVMQRRKSIGDHRTEMLPAPTWTRRPNIPNPWRV